MAIDLHKPIWMHQGQGAADVSSERYAARRLPQHVDRPDESLSVTKPMVARCVTAARSNCDSMHRDY